MAYLYDEYQETISQEDYDHAKDHLMGLLEDVYKTGSVEDLQFHLEEICHVFGLKVPESDPCLTQKSNQEKARTDRMLQQWVGYTRAYAEMLCSSTK